MSGLTAAKKQRPSKASPSVERVSHWSPETGIEGVRRCPITLRFKAELDVGRTRVILGRYDTIDEAAAVYAAAKAKYGAPLAASGDSGAGPRGRAKRAAPAPLTEEIGTDAPRYCPTRIAPYAPETAR